MKKKKKMSDDAKRKKSRARSFVFCFLLLRPFSSSFSLLSNSFSHPTHQRDEERVVNGAVGGLDLGLSSFEGVFLCFRGMSKLESFRFEGDDDGQWRMKEQNYNSTCLLHIQPQVPERRRQGRQEARAVGPSDAHDRRRRVCVVVDRDCGCRGSIGFRDRSKTRRRRRRRNQRLPCGSRQGLGGPWSSSRRGSQRYSFSSWRGGGASHRTGAQPRDGDALHGEAAAREFQCKRKRKKNKKWSSLSSKLEKKNKK